MQLKDNILTFDANDDNISWNVEVHIANKSNKSNDFGRFHDTVIKINTEKKDANNKDSYSIFMFFLN